MSVKTNTVLVCTLSLLLSACSGRASAPGSAEDAKISAEVDKILRDYQTGSDTSPQANASRYLARIQAAIFANIDQPASWQGQKCSVRFMLQRDGTVQDPTVESGDRPFCAQVMSALKKANIPPAPDEKNLSNLQSCRAGREALSLPAEMAPAITRAISNKIS
ncbi:TolA protein [Klebsiella pneumoniae]|nr:TolA protein [Klebsiella pneumoniae]